MSQFKNSNASQAVNWAQQRKEAMEKAKKLRDDRKYNFTKTGEMAMQSNITPNNQGLSATAGNAQLRGQNAENFYDRGHANTYNFGKPKTMTGMYNPSSMNDVPISDEEHLAVSSSLRLLKSKMNRNNDRSGTYNNADAIDSLAERDLNARGNQGSYGGYEPVRSRGKEYDNQDQGQNQNYRKVFKPSMNQGQSNYDQQDNGGYGGNYGNYGNYGNKQQSSRQESFNKPSSGYGIQDDYQRGYEPAPKKQPVKEKKKFVQPEWNFDTVSDPTPQPEPQRQSRGKPSQDHVDESEDYQPRSRQNQQQSQPQARQQKTYNPTNYSNTGSNNNNNNYGAASKQYGNQYSKEPLELPKSRETRDRDYQPYSKNTPSYQSSQRDADSYGRNYQQSKPTQQQKQQPLSYNMGGPKMGNRGAFGNEVEDRPLKAHDHGVFERGNERPADYQNLVECPEGCGRSFNEDALDKHVSVCRKIFQSKRKKFDIAAQRLTDDQVKAMNKQDKPMGRGGYGSGQGAGKQTMNKGNTGGALKGQAKWKQQSAAFRANLKAARGATLSKDEQVAVNNNNGEGRVTCDHCYRQFNEKAAERHIPFCKDKQKNMAMQRGPPKAMPKRR